MSVIVIPVAITIIFFSSEILTIWTRNQNTVNHTNILVSMLAVPKAEELLIQFFEEKFKILRLCEKEKSIHRMKNVNLLV